MANIKTDINDINYNNMMEYFNHINLERQIPYLLDGLKPIQRKILYTMYKNGYRSNKSFKKSARVSGDTTVLHPHSDTGIYDSAVNLVRKFSMNQPFIEGQGNFGSISGFGAAAPRYTEMRLNKVAEKYLLDGVNDNAVTMMKNFDGSVLEPTVLPSKLPFILVNGSFGIGGGGHKSEIPPHAIQDVINITIDRIKNPKKSLEDLINDNNFKPQFPYGGVAYSDNLVNLYETGRGRISLTSKIEMDEKKHTLTITEIPYMTNVIKIKDKIIEIIKEDDKEKKNDSDRRLLGLKDIKDGTEKGNVRLILYYQKNVDLNFAKEQLVRIVPVTKNIDTHMKLVYNDALIETNLIDIIDKWFEFRKSTIKRIKTFKIRDLRNRIHIIEGLLVVLQPKKIDKLIKIIKSGKDKEDIIRTIGSNFGISSAQSTYVSEMKLYTINNTEIDKLILEKEEKERIVEEEMAYIKDKTKLSKLIINELTSIKKDKDLQPHTRPTEYIDFNFLKNDKSLTVADVDYLIILTKQGKLKKVKAELSKPQKRNGKGISIGKLSDGDVPLNIFNANSRDYLFLVTETGKLFYERVYEFTETNSLNNLGRPISQFCNGEKVVKSFSLTEEEFKEPNTAFVVTTQFNRIKMVMVNEIRRSGLILIKLNEGDKVLNVHNINSKFDFNLMAVNQKGNIIRINKDDIPVQKRSTIGSHLFDDSEINEDNKVASTIVEIGEKEFVIISKKSLSKRVLVEEIDVRSRRIKGKMAAKFKHKDDKVMFISTIKDLEDNLIVVSNNKTINIPLSELILLKRTTYGNHLMKLNENEFCIDASIIR